MTIEQLTEIVGATSRRHFRGTLRRLGYIDCIKDKKLGEIGLIDLFNGDEQSTDDVIDKKHRFVYNGCIMRNVRGYGDYEFVILSVCRIMPSSDPFEEEHAFPCAMEIFAKRPAD